MEDDVYPIYGRASLFTLRIWIVNGDANAFQWRGRLQNIQSGEVYFCKDGNTLVKLIENSLLESNKQINDRAK